MNAQDFSRDQLKSLSNNYFKVNDGLTENTFKTEKIKEEQVEGKAKESVAVNVTWDTLYLGNKPKMFLCQDGNNWVIFANEQSVDPVVCLGEGHLDVNELKESPLWILLSESMIGLDSLRITEGNEKNKNKVAKQSTGNTSAVTCNTQYPTPLLNLRCGENKWNQVENNSARWCPSDSEARCYDRNKIYNKYCPPRESGTDGHAPVGCTAVAMAQVMWYYQWPNSAKIPDIGERNYNWANMPPTIMDDTPLDQVVDVTRLLRDCGYAGGMYYSYGGDWSSMILTKATNAFRDVFDYEAEQNGFNRENKEGRIKSEIAAGRPVIMQATHATNGSSHTFVIDGYYNDMFHINMGWGGSWTTWYSVSGADCYHHFTVARRLMHHIKPKNGKNGAVNMTPQSMDLLNFLKAQQKFIA